VKGVRKIHDSGIQSYDATFWHFVLALGISLFFCLDKKIEAGGVKIEEIRRGIIALWVGLGVILLLDMILTFISYNCNSSTSHISLPKTLWETLLEVKLAYHTDLGFREGMEVDFNFFSEVDHQFVRKVFNFPIPWRVAHLLSATKEREIVWQHLLITYFDTTTMKGLGLLFIFWIALAASGGYSDPDSTSLIDYIGLAISIFGILSLIVDFLILSQNIRILMLSLDIFNSFKRGVVSNPIIAELSKNTDQTSVKENNITVELIEKGEEWGKTLDEEKQPSEYSNAPYCKPDEDYAIFTFDNNTNEDWALSVEDQSAKYRTEFGACRLLKYSQHGRDPFDFTIDCSPLRKNCHFKTLQWVRTFDPTSPEDKNYRASDDEEAPNRSEDDLVSKNIDLFICTWKRVKVVREDPIDTALTQCFDINFKLQKSLESLRDDEDFERKVDGDEHEVKEWKERQLNLLMEQYHVMEIIKDDLVGISSKIGTEFSQLPET